MDEQDLENNRATRGSSPKICIQTTVYFLLSVLPNLTALFIGSIIE